MSKSAPNFNLSTRHLTDRVFELTLQNRLFGILAHTTKLQYTYQTLSLLMPEHPWGNHVVMAEGLLTQTSHEPNSGILQVLTFLLSNNFLRLWDAVSEGPEDLIDWVLDILRHTNLSTLGMSQNYSKLPFSLQAILERLFQESIQRSNLDAVSWLLQAGVDANLPLTHMLFENKFSLLGLMKPIEYAALVYDLPLIKLLIEHGAHFQLNNLFNIFSPFERRLQPDTAWLASIKLMLSKYESHTVDEYSACDVLNETSSIGRSCVSEIVIEFFRGKVVSETTICQLLVTAIRTQSPLTMELLDEYVDQINIVSPYGETPLTAAASEGNIGLCAYLLRLGASLRPCSEDFDMFMVATPLQCAAYFADKAMVIALLDAGADPNDLHPDNMVPYHGRCTHGPEYRLESEKAAYVIVRPIGRTALQAALLGDKIENALLLLSKGAQLVGGELAIAILNRQGSVISHLTDTEASLMGMPSSSWGISILEASIVVGDLGLIQDIIKANPKAITHWTLLAAVWLAKVTSDHTIVKQLLAGYAELELNDDFWLGTVMSLAVALDLMELVQTILGYGIRPASSVHPNVWDKEISDLRTQSLQDVYLTWRSRIPKKQVDEANGHPLIHVALVMDHPTYLELLLHAGYKPTTICANFVYGKKSIHLLRRLHENGVRMTHYVLAKAISRGDSECTEWLLSLDLDLNESEQDDLGPYEQTWFDGKTALQAAAQKGDMDLLEKLICLGANINGPAYRDSGATALQVAAIRGFFGVVQKLLDLGANPNAPGAEEDGRTALEGAAEHGRLDVLQLLLNSGVETEGPGQRQYVRAIGFAREQGHHAAANLLRSHRPWTQADQEILEEDGLLHPDQSLEEIEKLRRPPISVQEGPESFDDEIDDSVIQKPEETKSPQGEGLTTHGVQADSTLDTFEEDPYGVEVYVQEAAVNFWEPVYDYLTWETW